MSAIPQESSPASSISKSQFDEEKGIAVESKVTIFESSDSVKRDGIFSKLWSIVLYLDRFGVEVRGIERVKSDERMESARVWDSGLVWIGANCQISTVALGTLGAAAFGLELLDSALVILFFNLLTTLPVALFSTFGKNSGCRQMVVSRYSFGSIGIYFPILLNCLACLGWSTVNTIVGASALQSVNIGGPQIPTAAAVIVISVSTMVIALFGYKWVHIFERYAPVPIAVVLVLLLGFSAQYYETGVGGIGSGEAASILSFGAAIAGFGLGWSSLAADYSVNQPEEQSTTATFIWAYVGLNVPLVLLECLGAALMSTFTLQPDWKLLHDEYSIGGLVGAPLSRMGRFGDFCLVLLSLSIIANNIPNMYSFALTFQTFGRLAQAIPRIFLVVLGTIIYIIPSIIGAHALEEVLVNLLVVLGYWLAIYCVILIQEHFMFRGGSFKNYNLEAYNTPALLPVGYAAIAAIGFGIMGAVLGMAQILYTGVIGGMIGPPPPAGFGGDVGFLLSGAFTAVTFPIFRYLEKKYIGR